MKFYDGIHLKKGTVMQIFDLFYLLATGNQHLPVYDIWQDPVVQQLYVSDRMTRYLQNRILHNIYLIRIHNFLLKKYKT